MLYLIDKRKFHQKFGHFDEFLPQNIEMRQNE